MKGKLSLRQLIFLAICCDLGVVCKKMILPLANIVTDALHIPGGIGTAFSLMFLVIGAALTPVPFCGTLMGAAQSLIALSMGSVGSMGALAPIGYILPGLTVDAALGWMRRKGTCNPDGAVPVNAAASAAAALAANGIVFRLSGVVLLLYLTVAALSGALFGMLAAVLIRRLEPVVRNRGG